MAKTTVYKEPDGDLAPFLRGILTQSLVNAGLNFEEAYDLAQHIRTDLKDTDSISTLKLKTMVSQRLIDTYGTKLADRYNQELTNRDIIVSTRTNSEAFSLSKLTQSMAN